MFIFAKKNYRAARFVRKRPVGTAFARAKELIDLTIKHGRKDDPKGRGAMLEELCRFREFLCAAFLSRDMNELRTLN